MPTGIFTLKQQELALGQGAWTNQKPLAVDYLVVAGGGGAGADGPGGAGGGGVLLGGVAVTPGSAITVTVGGGGSGTSGSSVPGSGSNSVFGSISAVGGGRGANSANAGASGGSGGGAGILLGGYNTAAGQGTAGQGNAGGALTTVAYQNGGASSGGGGAGTVGLTPPAYNIGGAGGAGIGSAISGTLTGYGGGGAGATGNAGSGFSLPPASYGGGGGGNAGSNGASGTANTGGGGAAGPGYTGGSGGSGIVIISYPDTYAAPASTTGSPTVSTSGSGSIGFDGSTQVVKYSDNAALRMGTGNFTIEFWIYFNSISGYQTPFDKGYSGSGALLFQTGNGNGRLVIVVSNSVVITETGTASTGVWIHYALVRNGTTLTLYRDGTSSGSATNSTDINNTSTLGIGGAASGVLYGVNGYMSNIRVVKGTAVYTSNFTPPTAPLTAITNTSLLLNSVSGAYLADSSTNGFAPASGTVAPTWNQLSPFATGLGYKNRVYTWTSSGSITF